MITHIILGCVIQTVSFVLAYIVISWMPDVKWFNTAPKAAKWKPRAAAVLDGEYEFRQENAKNT